MTTMDLRERIRQRLQGDDVAAAPPAGDLRSRIRERMAAPPEKSGGIVKAFKVRGLETVAGAVEGSGIAAGGVLPIGAGASDVLGGAAVFGIGRRLESLGVNTPLDEAGKARLWQVVERSEPVRQAITQTGMKMGESVRAVAEQMGYQRSPGAMGLLEDVAGAVPQLAGAVGAGAAGTAIGGPLAGMATAAGFFAATDAGNQTSAMYRRMLADGVPEPEAASRATQAGAMYGVASGVLEFAGIGTVLRGTKLLRALEASSLRRATAGTLGAGVGEGLTEAAQGVLGEGAQAWAREDWDEFRRTWNDLDTRGREFLVGAILGTAVRGGVEALNPENYRSVEEMMADIETVADPATPSQPPATSGEGASAVGTAQIPATGGIAPEPVSTSGDTATTRGIPAASSGATPTVRIRLRGVGAPEPDTRLEDGTPMFRDRGQADAYATFKNERLTPDDTRVRVLEPLRGAMEPLYGVVPDTRLAEARARGEAQTAEVEGFARGAVRGAGARATPKVAPATPDVAEADASQPVAATTSETAGTATRPPGSEPRPVAEYPDLASTPDTGESLAGDVAGVPVEQLTRPALLAEAARLGVSEGAKSLPALAKRVGEARDVASRAPEVASESMPEVAQPTPIRGVTFTTQTLNGPKNVRAKIYALPGYNGPPIAVAQYKSPRGDGYRVYLAESGQILQDNNGVGSLEDSLKIAVQRVRNMLNPPAPRQTFAERQAEKKAARNAASTTPSSPPTPATPPQPPHEVPPPQAAEEAEAEREVEEDPAMAAEVARLDTEMDAADKAWSEADAASRTTKEERDRAGYGTKRRETLEKRAEKLAAAADAAWTKYDAARKAWYDAAVRYQAKFGNPIARASARHSLDPKSVTREQVEAVIDRETRAHVSEAVERENDFAGRLDPEADAEAVRMAVSEATAEFIRAPLMATEATKIIDRVRGAIRGNRLRAYRHQVAMSLADEGITPRGINDLYDADSIDKAAARLRKQVADEKARLDAEATQRRAETDEARAAILEHLQAAGSKGMNEKAMVAALARSGISTGQAAPAFVALRDEGIVELRGEEGKRRAHLTEKGGGEPPKAKKPKAAEALRAAADKLESDARAANAKLNIPRGRNIGATLPPAYYANLVKIGAAKILKGTAKFADWSAEMIRDAGERIRPHLRRIYRDALAEYKAIVDGMESPEPTVARVKRRIEDAGEKGPTPGSTPETRAVHTAYRAGLRAARDELPAIKAKIRDAVKAKGDARAAVVQGIREEIRALVEEYLPPEFRGRFLPELTTATSLGDLARAVNKLRLESARATGEQDFRQIRRMERYARLLPRRRPEGGDMSPREAFDAALQRAIELADKLKRSGRAVVTTEDIEAAADALAQLKSDMGQAIADALAAKRIFMATKRGTAEEHAKELAAKIRERPARAPEGSAEDVATPILRRVNLQMADLRNVTEALEDGQGVAYSLMVRNMRMRHEAYLSDLRTAAESLDTLARDAGYKGLADALAKTSGRNGEGVTERVSVTLGGKEWSIARGELMGLAAMDRQTIARVRAGSPIQFQRGRRRVPIKATIEEIDAATAQLTDQEQGLVDGLKDAIESNRDELFEAHFRLKGYYPEAVEGYWPSKRNTRFSPQRGLPEGWRGVSQRYIENVGFLREREGGRLPFVVGDAISTAMEHLDASLKVIHLAEATRDAASVIENPDVVAAVNERFGSSYNKALRDFLLAISLANEADATTMGRAVQWMNQNLAVAKLGLNPATWLRQIGGIARLGAQMPTQAFKDGLAGWRSVKTIDLIERSGYFWERYVGNVAGRFSPVGGESYMDIGKASGKLGLEDAVANIVSAWQNRSMSDLAQAFNQARNAAATTLEVLNAFDAVNARIAYAGWLSEAERRYQEWSDDERAGWATTMATESVRETQNSSSVLDAPLVGVRARGRGGAAFLVFTSDVLKARNRIAAAARRGTAELARHVAAEAVNVVWGRAVGWGIGAGVAATVVALSGDEEDWDGWREKYLHLDRELFNLARDVVGLIEPVALPEFLSMTRYQFSELNAPALEAVNESVRSALTAQDAAFRAIENREEMANFAVKLARAANTVSGTIGLNPMQSLMDRVLSQIDAQID